MSIYDLGGEAPTVTTEHNHKTMISDAFNLQWENKVNKAEHYGNESISLSTAQSDGLSNINDTLTQRVRIPKLDLSASIYRLFVFKKSQLSWRSTADYHHGVADLYVNDERNRIRTNLWHTAHALQWMRNRFHWTQEYRMSIDLNNIYAKYQERSDEIGKTVLTSQGSSPLTGNTRPRRSVCRSLPISSGNASPIHRKLYLPYHPTFTYIRNWISVES